MKMIWYENTKIAVDIFQEEFICNLEACKGACCYEGESGAPLSYDEIKLIEDNLEQVKPYMQPKGLELLSQEGFFEKDFEGDLVTTCIKGRDCVFANINEQGIYYCAIEKAFLEGKSSFRKPISCYLYPIRIEENQGFTELHYSRWYICSDACTLGKKQGVSVFKFLKQPLIQRFGEQWYQEVSNIASSLGY